MSGRLAVLLLFVATFQAEFPRSNAYSWVKEPSAVETITWPDKKDVTMRWEWSLSGREAVNQVEIKRYVGEANKDKTEKIIAHYYAVNGKWGTDEKYFTLDPKVGSSVGTYVELGITDVTKQGNNEDGTTVDVMKANYTYTCEMSVANQVSNPGPKSTTLVVYRRPSVRVPIDDNKRYISRDEEVTLKCDIQAGHPTPSIKWYLPTESSSDYQFSGNDLKIVKFTSKHSGVYNCTATNAAGSASAVAVLQYTGCSGCSIDNEIAIEMTKLTYSSEYKNPSSNLYKKLKKDIEEECIKIYTRKTSPVYSCLVTGFREGSVVALLTIKYPTGTKDPRNPLKEAIDTGTFAGNEVKKSFVSPTSPPTQSTKPTDTTTVKSSSDDPDSGARKDTEGGLSTGAIVAIVVVFSIIFLVIIVVLVVCMLKRKRPAPRNVYKQDGTGKAASAPLKSQPYRDPVYDNGPDKPKEIVYADLNFQDRYSNGGGPPPQYTAADYAEVRPSQPNQNDSQMEWDKDVDEKNEMWI